MAIRPTLQRLFPNQPVVRTLILTGVAAALGTAALPALPAHAASTSEHHQTTTQFAQTRSIQALPFSESLDSFSKETWKTHGGTWTSSEGSLHVTGNAGPKAELQNRPFENFQLDLELRADAPAGQAGVVFRASELAPGVDAYRGYYVGIHATENRAVWGKTQQEWSPIAVQPLEIDPDTWYHLRIQAFGSHLKIFLSSARIDEHTWPVFDGIDDSFSNGSVALRSLGAKASFRNLTIAGYTEKAPSPSYTNPVQPRGADPVVFQHQGTYYAYVTYPSGGPVTEPGIRLYTSKDLVHWSDRGFALKASDSWGSKGFWAPDLVERDGTFYLYYTVNERICVATANSPRGPFRQTVKAPMEPESIKIDGHVFEDDDGQRYFYYVTFNDGNEIWGGKLHDDMMTVDEPSLRRMVTPDQPWERQRHPVTEGPEILKHKGTYYLTYSGSHFESPDYAVGYATSDSPLGPWEKHKFNPILKSTSYAHGTAHHTFASSPDGRERFIIYHRHRSLEATEPRALSIDRIRFVPNPDGGPEILQAHGPTSSPQPMPSGAK